MRILNRIKERETFTPTENQIALYIQDHVNEVVNMPLEDLAANLYVSKSTIIRFCKKLGFHGHKELCVQLAKEVSHFLMDDGELDPSVPFRATDDKKTVAEKVMSLQYQAITETYQDLNTEKLASIAAVIAEKKLVYIYAADDNALAAMELKRKLIASGVRSEMQLFPGSPLDLALGQPADSVAVMISYQGRDGSLSRAARMLSEKNIPVYLITGPFKGSLAKYATDTVEVSYYEPNPKMMPLGSLSAISLVINVITALVFKADYDRNMTAMKNRAEIRKNISDQGE